MDRILPLVHNWGNIEYSNSHPKMKKKLTIEPLTQNVKTCKKTTPNRKLLKPQIYYP